MSDTAIISAVAVFVTAVAATIAYGQWQTAKWKLAADLYPLRYAAYQKLMDAFEYWYRQGDMNEEKIEKFYSSFNYARYLFGPDVRIKLDNGLDDIYKLTNAEISLARYKKELDNDFRLTRDDFPDMDKKEREIQEFRSSLCKLYLNDELFLPYLSIDYKNPSQPIARFKRRA